MPDLSFQVEGAQAVAFAAAPLLLLRLEVSNAIPEELIHSISLQCQIQIHASRRRYNAEEQKRLADLFGSPDRWSLTLRTMLWTHSNIVIPSFQGSALTDLPVHCTFDFNVAATKYFSALEDGHIPIVLQFRGTVFYEGENDDLQVSPLPWTSETRYQLPVAAWKQMMEFYYPNTALLHLRRDVFDRLLAYKYERGIGTWEQTIESMLP
jgi:hypothetical protein